MNVAVCSNVRMFAANFKRVLSLNAPVTGGLTINKATENSTVNAEAVSGDHLQNDLLGLSLNLLMKISLMF